MVVMPTSRCSRLSSIFMWSRSFLSRAPSGSSSRRTAGRVTSARARALLLAARELARLALGFAGETHALELLGHSARRLLLRHALAAQAEGDVLLHAQVREERVALEDGVGGALEGGQPGDVGAVEQDAAGARLLEARDHPQRGGLAAAARAEQREELAALDIECQLADGGELAEALRYLFKAHAGERRGSARCGRRIGRGGLCSRDSSSVANSARR